MRLGLAHPSSPPRRCEVVSRYVEARPEKRAACPLCVMPLSRYARLAAVARGDWQAGGDDPWSADSSELRHEHVTLGVESPTASCGWPSKEGVQEGRFEDRDQPGHLVQPQAPERRDGCRSGRVRDHDRHALRACSRLFVVPRARPQVQRSPQTSPVIPGFPCHQGVGPSSGSGRLRLAHIASASALLSCQKPYLEVGRWTWLTV